MQKSRSKQAMLFKTKGLNNSSKKRFQSNFNENIRISWVKCGAVISVDNCSVNSTGCPSDFQIVFYMLNILNILKISKTSLWTFWKRNWLTIVSWVLSSKNRIKFLEFHSANCHDKESHYYILIQISDSNLVLLEGWKKVT